MVKYAQQVEFYKERRIQAIYMHRMLDPQLYNLWLGVQILKLALIKGF